jgi:hypothetical protein
VNGDPNLRARLERLASNAGDPPERGLDRVAARRHRRLRRRRGAVVTAAALAVLLGGVSLMMGGSPDDDHVAVSPARRPSRAAAQLPDTVEVKCTPRGIDIPVASVRPQRDGMHLRVINGLATQVEVRVVKEDVWTGRQSFPIGGVGSMTQPVPPGSIQIGCFGAGVADSNTVELVDVHSYYTEPSLECPEDEQVRMTDLRGAEADRSARSMSTTTRKALASQGFDVDQLDPRPVRGYLSQRFSDPTDDPMVQVNRRDGDDPVAFVHLRRTSDQPDASWKAVAIDSCQSFFLEATSTESTAATG